MRRRLGGCKIAGARHEPARALRSDVRPLVRALRGAEVVVFHCMYSQQRGPMCAQLYARQRRRQGEACAQDVLVLRGGFNAFYKLYGKAPDADELFDSV